MATRSRENPTPVANAIERSRVYRTPVVATQHPYLYIYKVTLDRVRKIGKTTTIEAVTNPFIIAPIVYKVIHSYREIFRKPWHFIFDDSEYLFSTELLEERPEIQLFTTDDKNKKVRFRIKRFWKFSLTKGGTDDIDAQWSAIFIKLLLSQNVRFIPPQLKEDHELSIHARFYHFRGAMFYIPKLVNGINVQKSTLRKKIVQPGTEAWTGLYLAKMQLEDGDPVMNVGEVNKFFDSLNLNLLDFYEAIINKMGKAPEKVTLTKNSVMKPAGVADFTERLSGLKVTSDFVPEKDRNGFLTNGTVVRHYKFVRAMQVSQCAENYYLVTFNKAQKRKEDVRLDVWYENRGRPLKYPKLPLCEVNSGRYTDYLPMEMLFTCGKPTPFTTRLDPIARMEIPTLLSRTPKDHYRLTTEFVSKDMEYEKDPFMNAMDVKLDTQMVECSSRVLYKSGIISKDNSGEMVDMNNETGEFPLSRAYQTTDKELIFVACNVTNAINDDTAKAFCRKLVDKCKSRGMRVSTHNQYDKVNKSGVQKYIEKGLQFLENRKRRDTEILVFLFFVGNKDELLYGEIKMLSDLNHGVVTQVITEHTVARMISTDPDKDLYDYKSMFHHIWLKLNVKLGGVNQIVDFTGANEPDLPQLPSHERTMFIGIDAIHPSPNSPIRSFTLAAIVASLDRNATKYADRIMVNVNCNETVQHFEDHFALLLKEYHGERGHFPDRVVILRDGVSDSEMIVAASRELQSIKSAWKRCTDVKPPPFTYIVVQKRHRTRFYRSDVMENNANPFPGTVVTQGAVSPHKFDFYMISHSTPQGTSRPAHYTVVMDESAFSTDEITVCKVKMCLEMCFRLCCLYARCSKPVSIPAPVYYAHLKCKRAAVQFQFAARPENWSKTRQEEIRDKEKTETDQTYKERVAKQALSIEKFLNRDFTKPKIYPGMAWL
ncbi:hypothetical protein PRIPAC_93507 [Pristionchus pacificus]|uniref:Piwi domain-containing protein n=1 Tax=Pristionchus pacificus TaxID=54126 RepID=A0A2A6BQG9_PRIPA|nr:hypothetical protein PRIPAC_93507 [Pristionchus pacificus]|eukprot:PDM68033.1 hypothetical protein PRIPAC_46077 [Pristionchus pacificus]